MRRQLIVLGLCVGVLCTLGIIMLYSTTFRATDVLRFRSQVGCLGAGLVLLPLLARCDYAWLQRRSLLYLLGGLCLVLLVAVFIPGIGMRVNGANRWIRGLGQPAEFVKPALVILLAAWCASARDDEMRHPAKGFLIALALGGVPAALVFVQQDWGTAMLLGAITLAMLFVAGARSLHLGVAVLIITGLMAIALVHDPVRLDRIMVFLDPELHRHGAGWQVWQSLLAIGSGGPWGSFLLGSLHKFGYVPEQQTDFIFARVGEETGLWGTSLVVLLYAGILICGFQIARHARERFGHYLAAGVTTVIVLQAWMNMAVATSLVPNKGLPLPFVSYGGSSLLAMFICVGLLASVAWHSNAGRNQARNTRPASPMVPGKEVSRAWSSAGTAPAFAKLTAGATSGSNLCPDFCQWSGLKPVRSSLEEMVEPADMLS